ncbi:MAG TPA: hypothetical protein P5527_02625 [Kiritimatiellia bacterium]|jgi:hypothetical protein|nr:hypothetical protein [Kiritimatiellia bacterium]
MSSSSETSLTIRSLCLLPVALALLGLAGCMADNPNETDMPWAAPAGWEGTMPLPGGYRDRYQ